MQQQEREMISGLFDRLQPFEAQPRDREAESLIAERVARQPAAAYLLVQAVLVQEQALKASQERIAELEAKAGEATPSFLGSAPRLGPWGAASPQPAPRPPAPPATRSPLQAALSPQSSGGGGGFLRSALATAAGVAGGALLFEGIRSMMGNNPGAFGPALAQTPSSLLPPDSLPADSLSPGTADAGGPFPGDDPADDYDGASLDQDQDSAEQDFGGSDDDSWA